MITEGAPPKEPPNVDLFWDPPQEPRRKWEWTFLQRWESSERKVLEERRKYHYWRNKGKTDGTDR